MIKASATFMCVHVYIGGLAGEMIDNLKVHTCIQHVRPVGSRRRSRRFDISEAIGEWNVPLYAHFLHILGLPTKLDKEVRIGEWDER